MTRLGQVGEIASVTVIRVPPAGFEHQAPYPVVTVRFSGGKQEVGQLVDWQAEDLVIGRKVRAVIRRIREPGNEGIIPYGIKYRPV